MTIAEVMTNDLAKLDVDSTAAEAARLMKEHNDAVRLIVGTSI